MLTPIDLAFAGEGTVLPPATQDLILEGCVVAGAREALEDTFRASRTASRATCPGVPPAAPAQARPFPHRPLEREGLAGSRDAKHPMLAFSGPGLHPAKRQKAGPDEPRLREKESARFRAAVARCFDLLEEIGNELISAVHYMYMREYLVHMQEVYFLTRRELLFLVCGVILRREGSAATGPQ